ncbi:caltractin [Strongylocentrotus purpuratus]|uniref:EF-hand domain-containing protein n=1 Tax=Strongylocentrotus purpuratus TaxID=7668 RepID=A0A7M7NWX1_STRPU|nr:caltractin [Strongylocentrotus purpuratus]
MPAKVKKKRAKSKSPGSAEEKNRPRPDPIPPQDFGPEEPKPSHRESLQKVLTGDRVDLQTKEFMGCRISTKVFEQLTTHEIRDLKTVFDAFADKRGMIRADHIRRAMRSLGFKVSKTEAVAMVADIDLDRSGTIDFNEFLLFIIDKQGTARDVQAEISQGFKMMDYDNTGKLTLDNLKRAAKESGVKFTEADLREMVEEADRNGDNMVDLQEFSTIMLKTNLF